MNFMNEHEIRESVRRHARHPALGPATRFLEAYMEQVNAHSDGWPYWSAPVRAAAKLISLIQHGNNLWRDGRGEEVTLTDVRRALTPIKSFMTRKGNRAGMQMPVFSLMREGREP